MIRALSLAAALAVLPLSAALADEPQTASEAAIEAAAEAFEARMEAFGERAEAISEDESLSEAQREARIAAIWTEYQPEVAAFTAEVSRHAGQIAQEALANIDVEALVADALNDPEVQEALRTAPILAQGMVTNGAWAANDPEQMVTYGLIAQYALDQATNVVVSDDAEAVEAGDEATED
jgi:enamine deaminase RidA (YjgF/YER057c/UK114 family)